jgi:hypothetical protein
MQSDAAFISHIFFHGVRLSPLGTAATVWPIEPAPDDDDDCGVIGGMRIDRGNRSTRRKPASVPLRTLKIPHDLTRGRTRAAVVGSRRLTPELRHGLTITLLSYTGCPRRQGQYSERP